MSRRIAVAAAWMGLFAVFQAEATEIAPSAVALLPKDGGIVYLMPASFGRRGPMLAQDAASSSEATQVVLVAAPADSPDLCVASARRTLSAALPTAVVVPRGNCSFQAKALEAERLGFVATIVVNTIAADYAAAMPNLTSITSVEDLHVEDCDADCGSGSGWVSSSSITLEQALLGNACPIGSDSSQLVCPGTQQPSCVLTGTSREAQGPVAGKELYSCCLSDHNLIMASSTTEGPQPTIPVYSATIRDGHRLLQAASASFTDASATTLGLRWVPSLDPSAAVTWIVGFSALLIATWFGAEEERARLSESQARSDGTAVARPSHARPLEAVPLTMRDTVLMLLGAAVMLSLLFVLIQVGVSIVYIVIGLYCLGGTSALALLVFHPCWSRIQSLQRVSCHIPCVGDADGPGVASAICAFSCMLVWVICRHMPWSWVAQDLVGIAMCMLFCRQISIPSVRVAAAMGAIFLVYDVIMVFITPLIVGSSVMIDVATAGAPVAVFDQACYCRLNPDDWSVCGPGERMPILFAVPRMLDYRGGYSLLGLGDIVIPGLIVTLALRLDLAIHKGWRGMYWITSIVGYATGLACAQVAATVTGSGQPALLYIIPFVTMALMLVSWYRGEFGRVWLYGADSPSTVARQERRRRRRRSGQQQGDNDGDEDQGSDSDGDARGMLAPGSGGHGGSSHDDTALVSGTGAAIGEGGAFMGESGMMEFTEAGQAGAVVLGDDYGDDDTGGGGGGSGGQGSGSSAGQFQGTVDDDLAGGDLGSGTGQIWGAERAGPRVDAVGATAVELSELVGGVGKDEAHDDLL